MDRVLHDIRYAARGLWERPGFTLMALSTLAIGIGATTLVFSLVSALLLNPLPVAVPERLVTVDEKYRGGTRRMELGYAAFSFSRYEAYRDASREVLADLAGYRLTEGSLRTATGHAQVVSTVAASANYFGVLGLRPAHGRVFAPDASRSAERGMVISYELWTTRFGADPGAIGRLVHWNSTPYTVIGVAPRGFSGTVVGLPVDVWVPAAAGDGSPNSGDHLALFGRLRDQATRAQAAAALEVIARQVPAAYEGAEVVAVRVQPLTAVPAFARGATIGFMSMLLATAALVLVIASTNTGGMLLARGAARRREIAVRLAIGAGRWRLVRQLLTESLLLFLLGGGAGVLLAAWLIHLVSVFQPPFPMRVALDFGIDGRVLAFACAAALLAGLVFGLAPALRASRADVLAGLKDDRPGESARRTRLRGAFVVVQLALSLVLLVTAGLFARTLQKALASDIGFNPDGVVVARIDPGAHRYDQARGRALQARLLDRVRAMPGVEAAAFAVSAPMGGQDVRGPIHGEDAEGRVMEDALVTSIGTVGNGYFETLQVPLVAGRAFTAADRPGAPAAAVINETLARQLWPGESPIGRRLRMGDSGFEVVGVARDGKYEAYTDARRPFLYLPLEQRYAGAATLHVRARTDAATTLAAVRRELAALDPNIALEQAAPLGALIGVSIFPQRLAATLVGVFGLTGLLLAAVGLYGVLAYQVSARTREIGIRMALGAHAAGVTRLVMRYSLRLVFAGTALGLAAAFAVTRLLENLLYDIAPADPLTFAAVPLLLIAVALIASCVPARRATRVDPTVALRSE